jgi:hypothetical protein
MGLDNIPREILIKLNESIAGIEYKNIVTLLIEYNN